MPSTFLTQLNNKVPGNYSDPFLMIENYIYLHHVDKFLVLPSFVDSVTDSQPVNFQTTYPLSRSAPIYSYANSGPRTIQTTFDLHRDLMYDINKDVSNIPVTVDNDYVDLFIKYIQAATLPSYEAASKMVNPPQVSLRLGNDIFIKGVISQTVGITYKYPVLSNGKYADIQISLTISEIDPYDANTVLSTGSFRYVSTTLNRVVAVVGDSGEQSIGSVGRAVTNENTVALNIQQESLRGGFTSGGRYGGSAGRSSGGRSGFTSGSRNGSTGGSRNNARG